MKEQLAQPATKVAVRDPTDEGTKPSSIGLEIGALGRAHLGRVNFDADGPAHNIGDTLYDVLNRDRNTGSNIDGGDSGVGIQRGFNNGARGVSYRNQVPFRSHISESENIALSASNLVDNFRQNVRVGLARSVEVEEASDDKMAFRADASLKLDELFAHEFRESVDIEWAGRARFMMSFIAGLIYVGGAGEPEALHAGIAARAQQSLRSVYIQADGESGIAHGIWNKVQRGEMDDNGRTLLPEVRDKRGFVANVFASELKERVRGKWSEMLPVATAQIVESDDGDLALQKLLDNVRAEKAGRSCYEPGQTCTS